MRFFAVNLMILVFLSGVFGENANSSQAASQAEAQPKSKYFSSFFFVHANLLKIPER